MENDFRDKTIAGISWNILNQVAQQLLALIVSIILARILTPEDFGLVGLVTVFTGFAIIFLDLGFGAALVQRLEVTHLDLSSIFWFNILMGLLLTMVFIILAPFIADFYDEPDLRWLIIALSSSFFINSTAIVQNNLFLKRLDFKILTLRNIGIVTVSGGVAIACALSGLKVWSLVIQTLLSSFLSSIVIWNLSDWRPEFKFSWESIQKMKKFSSNLVANNIFNYWTRNADNLLIGKFVGTASLGIYSKAYGLMLLPINNFSRVIGRVLFPSFSLIQNDVSRIKAIYLKITRIIALFTFPMMIGLLVIADKFVLVVFGEQWKEMIPILRILCVPGMIQSILALNGSIYQSMGRTDMQFKVTLWMKLFVLGAIIIGINWGLMGVTWSYAIASILIIYPNFYYPGKLIHTSFVEFLQNFKIVFVLSSLMGLLVWTSNLLTLNWDIHIAFLVQLSLGLISYFLLINIFKVKAYSDLIKLLEERYKERKASI